MQLWLIETFGMLFVNVEAPIDVRPEDNPTNEPVPHLIVLSRKGPTITSGNPHSKDISLVVEISNSTLNFDRTLKAALYAGAGLVEYSILDVANHRLYSHRDPVAGSYQSIVVYSEHETLAPLAAPNSAFSPSIAFAE